GPALFHSTSASPVFPSIKFDGVQQDISTLLKPDIIILPRQLISGSSRRASFGVQSRWRSGISVQHFSKEEELDEKEGSYYYLFSRRGERDFASLDDG
ncbi:MAG: hypothetical protein ABSH52_27380, partial [Terriglobia bacterium]